MKNSMESKISISNSSGTFGLKNRKSYLSDVNNRSKSRNKDSVIDH
jgi:hypothetical protein